MMPSAPSKSRMIRGSSGSQLACSIKEICKSCLYVNEPYEDSLKKKHQIDLQKLNQENLIADAVMIPPVPSPKKLNYRASFKLPVAPKEDGTFQIGLYQPGTHNIIEMDECPIHTAGLRRLIFDLREILNLSALKPFSESKLEGDIRYITARAAAITGEIILTFVVSRPLKQPLLQIVQKLRRLGHKINSCFMNINAEVGNAIFGTETIHVTGQDALRERVCELDIDVPPTAFFQINPWQAQFIYRRIEQHVGSAAGHAVAWDFYCGLGQIGLILARSGFKVLGVEENPAAIETAKQNAVKNNLSDRAEFIAAKVEEFETKLPDWARHPKWIVVNPSRRGIDPTARGFLTHTIRQCSAKLIYVSCDIDTFVRDLIEFKKAGIRIKQIESFDMFAQTDKLEWLAVLSMR